MYNLDTGPLNSIPSPCSTSKHNAVKFSITISLPSAAYVPNIALSGIEHRKSRKSKLFVATLSEVFTVTDMYFPSKSKLLPLISKAWRCLSLPAPHPALHPAHSTVLITILCHPLQSLVNIFFTEEQQAGQLNLSQNPRDTRGPLSFMKQVCSDTQSTTEVLVLITTGLTKSPAGSFAFILVQSVVPAVAAAKSSWKKLTMHYSSG